MFDSTVPLPLLGSLLFTLMGPIAAIPLFAATTAGADPALRLKIALTAYGTALIGLFLAVFVGAGAMGGWGVSPPALIAAAGLILTLTAVRGVLGLSAHAPAGGEPKAPTVALGFAPIAIPGLVSPMAVAILVIFVSYFPAMNDKLAIMGVAALLMTVNLGAMLIAHWFMRVVGMAPLVVLGAVFGVLQVALGVEMIFSGLSRSGLLS